MATILQNESAWSTTPATNANVDTGVNWVEGQDAATVNDSARGMMTARAKARWDQGGKLVAGGSANALTVTTNQVLSTAHIADGQRLLIRAVSDNTSATVVFAPDGLANAPIRRANGTQLGFGSIKAGMFLDLVYYSASSEWRCINIPPVSAGVSAFQANKNFVNQTQPGPAANLVTWSTEVFDIGGFFENTVNYSWTPPAGIALLAGGIKITGVQVSDAVVSLVLYKNSVSYKVYTMLVNASGNAYGTFSTVESVSGTDDFKLLTASVADTSYVIDGTPGITYFSGSML